MSYRSYNCKYSSQLPICLSGYVIACAFLSITLAIAEPHEICVYLGADGKPRQANALRDIPANLRKQARCFPMGQNEYLAPPQEVSLEGATRREDINSPLGRIYLRWPRKIESIFGRTPLRAVTDAAQTVSRTLNKSSFPLHLQQMKLPWQVVFLDADLPETQIPSYLINNCHPGWMTPPANIYIVGQRVAGGCGGMPVARSVADSRLAEVLIHEMGHAVEFHLLGPGYTDDQLRAEGFASWFEQHAAQYSAVANVTQIRFNFATLAKQSLKEQPQQFVFQGSAPDYARASMYFNTIVDRRGIANLIEVYETISEHSIPFFAAVEKRLGWNKSRLEQEATKYIMSLR